MNRKPCILILFFCLLLQFAAGICMGQHFAMQHYTTDDGLPSNVIYDIYRDRQGFLWFGSDKGATQYNGIRFKQYSTFDGLADNEVFGTRQDAMGRLWFYTYNGEFCFCQDGVFHNAANTPWLRSKNKVAFIDRIQPGADSSVIFYFSFSTKFAYVKNNRINWFTPPPIDGLLDHVECVAGGRFLLIYSTAKAFLLDSNSNIIKPAPVPPFFYFRQQTQDQEYVFTQDSIFRLWPGNSVTPFARKKLANIFRIYSSSEHFFVLTQNQSLVNDSIELIKGVRISAVTQDVNGDYWVSTLGNGVYKLPRRLFDIKEYADIYASKVVFARYIEGHIVYTVQNGNVYDYCQGKSTLLLDYEALATRNHLDKSLPARSPKPGMNGHAYFSLMSTTGIYIDDIFSGKKNIRCFSLDISDPKTVFLVNGRDIYTHDWGDIHRTPVIGNTGTAGKLSSRYRERIFCMQQDARGDLWYTTINSLYTLRNNINVKQLQLENAGIKRFMITGRWLLGYTHTNKLLICDHFTTHPQIDTIPDQNCIWDNFYEVDSAHILISTDNQYRLLTLRLDKKNRTSFSIAVVENPFIPVHAEYVCPGKDICWFFKNGSIIRVQTSQLYTQPQSPRLLLTDISTTNKRYASFDTGVATLTIPYGEAKKISIHFTALSFRSKEVGYEYSISENGKTNWQPVANEAITLLSPSFGDYTLKIRAHSLSSAWSVPLVLELHILKPWWAKAWFIAVSILAILLLMVLSVFFLLKLRLHLEKRKHAAELRFLKSEYKAMNALMNPHFIFNSLNNIQGLINRDDKLAANKFLNYFSTLVRQNMHNIADELIPLQREIELVENYLKLEKLRFREWFNYGIDVSSDVDTTAVMISPLLVQPLVENAIKHGLLPRQSADNFVQVRIYRDEEHVCIEVKDNGVGLHNTSADISHQSFGLRNIQQRIAQLRAIHGQHIGFRLEELKDGNGKVLGSVALVWIKV